MFIKLDAKVYTDLDGKHVGKLHFVALDPKTHNMDSIVVERGL
jgi:sporulation protein YlmC with PRC-barrel domain